MQKFVSTRTGMVLLVLLSVSALSGCGAVVSAGATVGVAAVQERGIKGKANDITIEALILDQYVRVGLKLTTTIGVEVYEGRVLLTGATTDSRLSDQAVKLAWKVDGVKEVLNEIQTTKNTSATDYAQDTWITAQLKSKLTFDIEILAINYVVETVNGTVYLIGVGQNQAEIDRAVQHATGIKYVRKVISHVRLKKVIGG
ncbi:MAG: BON domain-containing protein [Rhodospirillales bacterium]|nr:BON domain-containing protein [Rhodospirillales bacterium]